MSEDFRTWISRVTASIIGSSIGGTIVALMLKAFGVI